MGHRSTLSKATSREEYMLRSISSIAAMSEAQGVRIMMVENYDDGYGGAC
jgi:hypothetical protein